MMLALTKRLLTFIWPLLIGVTLGVVIVFVYSKRLLNFSHGFISPSGSNPQVSAARILTNKPLIGFLPYWTVNSAQIPYHLLDELVYFGVTLQANGTIKKNNDQYVESGWQKLQSEEVAAIFKKAKAQDVKTSLAITVFDNQDIDAIISSSVAKKQAIFTIASLVEEYELDGINIDFEYNNAYPITQGPEAYSEFIAELRPILKASNPDINLTVDLYASAFIYDELYNAKALSQSADQLVLMGYDFHRSSSTNAGPVAPLRSQYGKSITEALQAALDNQIKPEKITLAMPFYGYEWQTVDDAYGSPAHPGSGAMASYQRVYGLMKENQEVKIFWDHLSMSPWLVYGENGQTNQIYFENDVSISLKLQLIDQVKLGGGAIWALGYEGDNATVWNVVEQWRLNHNYLSQAGN